MLSGCESDVEARTFFGGGGGGGMYIWRGTVVNSGSTASGAYLILDLPQEAEFAPEGSLADCAEGPTDRVTCALSPLPPFGLGVTINFRFPSCLPAGSQLTFTAYAFDQFNDDLYPANNTNVETVTAPTTAVCP
jgi:hypothetical protein